VTAAVYYQSVEAIVAKKFLGNLADVDRDFVLEPCVLDGPCDGRTPSAEPAVVEGAPPVPVEVTSWTIRIDAPDTMRGALRVAGVYPRDRATAVFDDVVVKAFFSAPPRGVNADTFTLTDRDGRRVPASVDQIGDGTWALFPNRVFLERGATYTARLARGLCDDEGHCTTDDVVWRFTIASTRDEAVGDTTIPIGFSSSLAPTPPAVPSVKTVSVRDGASTVDAVFSTPVMNVTPRTFLLERADGARCDAAGAVSGHVRSNRAADVWTFAPDAALAPGDYCVRITADVYDLEGHNVATPFTTRLTVRRQR
jgi:hypothetical protein